MYRLLFTTLGFLEYNLSIFLRRFTGMKSRLQKKWNNGKMLAELKPAFFLSLTFCFMIFIYAPLELYINNVDEFWYDVYLLFPFIIKDFFLFLLLRTDHEEIEDSYDNYHHQNTGPLTSSSWSLK